MWVSNMHFLSSGYFRQKSWTQGMSFCMATDGHSDGCAIDLKRLRLLAVVVVVVVAAAEAVVL